MNVYKLLSKLILPIGNSLPVEKPFSVEKRIPGLVSTYLTKIESSDMWQFIKLLENWTELSVKYCLLNLYEY